MIEDNFKKCEEYHQPAIILDADFNIIYKNGPAKIVNIKPRVGTNIKKYMDSETFEKLRTAVEKDEFKILKLDIYSSIKRCIVQPDRNSVTALIFYDVLNFLRENNSNESEIINKIEDIIYKYNKQKKAISKPAGDNSPFFENSRKMIRINEHFRRHIINLTPRGIDKYCDVGRFLNNYVAGISRHINSFGYKIMCDIEDRMFFYMLNEDDLLLINFILSAAAFKYSIFNKVDIRFFSDFYTGTLRYEFKTSNDFFKTHEDMFVKDYLDEIKDIKYLNLNLAALVAKNNDLKLRVYFDSDEVSIVRFDLIFDAKKTGLDSPIPDEQMNYITIEEIEEKAETEFAENFCGEAMGSISRN